MVRMAQQLGANLCARVWAVPIDLYRNTRAPCNELPFFSYAGPQSPCALPLPLNWTSLSVIATSDPSAMVHYPRAPNLPFCVAHEHAALHTSLRESARIITDHVFCGDLLIIKASTIPSFIRSHILPRLRSSYSVRTYSKSTLRRTSSIPALIVMIVQRTKCRSSGVPATCVNSEKTSFPLLPDTLGHKEK